MGWLVERNDGAFAQALGKIRYFGTICTVLELDRPLSNIYWLNVADKGLPFGGIIEHTNLVGSQAYGGSHIAYLSRYYSHDEAIARLPLEEVQARMIGALDKIYPRFDKSWIKSAHIFQAPMSAVVCGLHYSRTVPPCRTPIKNLYLAGMCHIYPDERSCNNAIRVAAEACRVMGMDSSFVPRRHSLSGRIGM